MAVEKLSEENQYDLVKFTEEAHLVHKFTIVNQNFTQCERAQLFETYNEETDETIYTLISEKKVIKHYKIIGQRGKQYKPKSIETIQNLHKAYRAKVTESNGKQIFQFDISNIRHKKNWELDYEINDNDFEFRSAKKLKRQIKPPIKEQINAPELFENAEKEDEQSLEVKIPQEIEDNVSTISIESEPLYEINPDENIRDEMENYFQAMRKQMIIDFMRMYPKETKKSIKYELDNSICDYYDSKRTPTKSTPKPLIIDENTPKKLSPKKLEFVSKELDEKEPEEESKNITKEEINEEENDDDEEEFEESESADHRSSELSSEHSGQEEEEESEEESEEELDENTQKMVAKAREDDLEEMPAIIS